MLSAGDIVLLDYSYTNQAGSKCRKVTFDLPAALVRSKNGGILNKSSEKSSEKILRHLRETPTASAKVLAEKLGISSRAVEKQIDLLKKAGFVCRVGPAKGGHWEVFE